MKEGYFGRLICNLHWLGVNKTAWEMDQSMAKGLGLGMGGAFMVLVV
jgi:hypothetical protein